MRRLRGWLARIAGLFRKRRSESEFAAEMEGHLAMHIDDNLRTGMTAEEARRQALIKLGGVEQTREKYRERSGLPFLETLLQDFRFGFRMMRKNPGFAVAAVLTMALGIGANTAAFSLLDAMLLRELPVNHPRELVLFSDDPSQGTISGTETGRWFVFSYPSYLQFREHDESFQDLCAFQADRNRVRVRVPGSKLGSPTESARGKLVSGNYFKLLGVNAIAGRTLEPEDDRPGASPTAVLNYGYWKRRFGTDASLVGKTLEINDVPVTIVGVAPPEFFGENVTSIPNFWLPLSLQPQVTQRNSYLDDPSTHWLNIMGRLKEGVKLQKAQTVVSVQLRQMLAAQAGSKLSADIRQDIDNSYIQLAPGKIGISALRVRYSEALHILLGVAGLVLLIACANVANLLLSQAVAREKEFSVRLTLGASRGRLRRQLLTESMLLAVIGAVLGTLLAQWGAKTLLLLVAGNATPLRVSPDVTVLGFTTMVCVLSGILFGIFPTLRATRADVNEAMKGPKPVPKAAGLWLGLANGLVIFQVAASMVLIVGAGLLLGTLRNLMRQELGFDQEHVLIAGMDPRAAGYTPAQALDLNRLLIEHLETAPGVRSASYEYTSPLSGSESSGSISIEGMPPRPEKEMGLHRNAVGPHYFETLGIPIVLGRGIEPRDTDGSPKVAVVNQAMVNKFFAGTNPIGKRFSSGGPHFDEKYGFVIVGVARDARFYSVRGQIPPMAFVAASQLTGSDYDFGRSLDIRAVGDPRTIENEVRRVIAESAPGLPLIAMTLLSEQVDGQLFQERMVAGLSSAFGGLALLLASVGLYGTIAFRVARRTRELGIRIALGADRGNVLRMVMSECLVLVGIGLCAGVPLSMIGARLIANQLFGLSPLDPFTMGLAAVVLTTVAALAGFVAARQAARVDPLVALRYE
jgi:predicted permease